MGHRFAVGLDLGKLADASAVVTMEAVEAAGRHEFHIRDLHRFPLGTHYHVQAAAVARMMQRLERVGPARLVTDYTGVGTAVDEVLRKAGLHPTPVMITSGAQESREKSVYHVPKATLVVGLQADFQAGVVKIANALPLAEELIGELMNVEYKITQAANVQFVHREGTHDDLVLAACLARWGLKVANRMPAFASLRRPAGL